MFRSSINYDKFKINIVLRAKYSTTQKCGNYMCPFNLKEIRLDL